MTRPIKFRAWDTEKRFFLKKEKGQMIYPNEQGLFVSKYGLGQKETYYISWNGKILSRKWDGCDSQMEYVDAEEPEITLMQFTGLTDKNGKEIYEGDIVKHRRLDGSVDIIKYGMSGVYNKNKALEVKWDNCGFYPFSQYINVAIKDLEFEVIGNAFDNPDLLK